MGKIGVCACYNSFNYGSMLQTMATLKQLENMGYEYELINYTKKLTLDLLFRSIDRIPSEINERLIIRKKKREIAKYSGLNELLDQRKKCFNNFMNENFINKLSKPCNRFSELHEMAKKYDAVLVGSDQLWTPRGYSTGFYNLLFVPDEITKISYATSFGVSDIPNNKKVIARKFLNRIEHISVRELRASEMVKELTGKDVPTVVDPTLLFTGREWENMIKDENLVPEKPYIFCYFLGDNPEQRKEVEKLRNETGYSIVFIPHLDEFIASDINFGDKQLFNVGPADFVNLIRHAEYVCTDSFHGSVFSILNHKKFVTFNRFKTNDSNSRNSRIDSLLSQTSLEKRRFNGNLVTQIHEPIDFEEVEKCLYQMRKKSHDYLSFVMDNLEK